MRAPARSVDVVDYHTEGEPMRIVTGGVGPVPGRTLMERCQYLDAHERALLGFILSEPRGHAAMCGAILTPPVDPEADAGVLFIEPLGPVHMCGHGAIAVAAMLAERGGADRESPVDVALETPAGIVRCRVAMADGHAVATTIRNVPAFSAGLDLAVDVPGVGRVGFDLAYGGHFYALVAAEPLGLGLDPADGPRLIEVGERIRLAIEASTPLVHPGLPGARGLLYVQFFGPGRRPDASFRNAVVVAPAGLDRSPCGTGTSARMANLHARSRLAIGEPFVHESIIGSVFTGRIAELTEVGGAVAIVPEITGRAWAIGRGTLFLDPADPFPAGFRL